MCCSTSRPCSLLVRAWIVLSSFADAFSVFITPHLLCDFHLFAVRDYSLMLGNGGCTVKERRNGTSQEQEIEDAGEVTRNTLAWKHNFTIAFVARNELDYESSDSARRNFKRARKAAEIGLALSRSSRSFGIGVCSCAVVLCA